MIFLYSSEFVVKLRSSGEQYNVVIYFCLPCFLCKSTSYICGAIAYFSVIIGVPAISITDDCRLAAGIHLQTEVESVVFVVMVLVVELVLIILN